MRSFFISTLTGFAAATLMEQSDFEFIKFVAQFNKQYNTAEEYAFRAINFKKTLAEVKKLNSSNGSSIHGINHMSDWTPEEYSKLLGLKHGAPKINTTLKHNANSQIADSINWIEKGVVNPVKDQAQCGSCWAFATTAANESAHAIATGELISLSEQQLVDCSSAQGNMACYGGWYYWAWDYLKTAA